MAHSKLKRSRKVEVEETENGVILHLTSTDESWAGLFWAIGGIVATSLFSCMMVNYTIFSTPQIIGMIITALLIGFFFIGFAPSNVRIVLDSNEVRLEHDNAYGTRIMVCESREAIKEIGVFYFSGKHLGRARIMLEEGGHIHLIEETGANCQKIADVLNHNLLWIKQ